MIADFVKFAERKIFPVFLTCKLLPAEIGQVTALRIVDSGPDVLLQMDAALKDGHVTREVSMPLFRKMPNKCRLDAITRAMKDLTGDIYAGVALRIAPEEWVGAA